MAEGAFNKKTLFATTVDLVFRKKLANNNFKSDQFYSAYCT
jgi:hypothetical protein